MPIVRAVFLDGYGTLIHAPRAFERAVELARQLDCHASTDLIHAALQQEMLHYRDHCHEAWNAESLQRLLEDCADLFLAAIADDDAPLPITRSQAVELLLDSFRFELFGEVISSLTSLRSLPVKLGVISNFDYRLPQLLADLDAREYFDFVLTSADFEPKPARTMFDQALRIVGTPPVQVIHVGDEVESDVEPARACGIRPVLLARNGATAPGDVVMIRSLSELPALVA